MAQTKPTARQRVVARVLSKLRAECSLSQADVAREMGWSKSKQEKIEAGNINIRLADVRALLALYGVTDKERVEYLADLTRRARQPGWWHVHRAVVPSWAEVYFNLEEEASSLRTFQQELVYGLLQTPEYIRALVTASIPRLEDDEIERIINVRVERQRRLETSSHPLTLWVIMSEAVLRRQLHDRAAWTAQLKHILEKAELPTVTMQVLPFSAGPHASMGASFDILGFPESADLDVLYLEARQASSYQEETGVVAEYSEVFDYLRGQALDPRKSLDFVAHLHREA
ncbi:helix-turn-helix transcriptional regulator [Spirillospora sp. NPDC052269]